MLLYALVATAQNLSNTYDVWAHIVFIGPPTLVFLILGIRGAAYTGWGFLVSAFGAEQAADYGLTSLWYYAGAFVLATVLTQAFSLWRDLPRISLPARRLGPPDAQ